MPQPKIILASTSSIRRSVLTNAGLNYEVLAPKVDEVAFKNSNAKFTPKTLAIELAKHKALSISQTKDCILGADQTLECNHVLYNKPETMAEAHRQLEQLQNQTHYLHSALALSQNGKIIWQTVETAELTMRPLAKQAIQTYLERAGTEILSCGGAYQFEGVGIQLFKAIKGDYFTILGLPLLPLLAVLRKLGIIDQ